MIVSGQFVVVVQTNCVDVLICVVGGATGKVRVFIIQANNCSYTGRVEMVNHHSLSVEVNS